MTGWTMTDGGTELMTAAAQLYYRDGLDQQAVAGILGVSRSTVSRLLTAAREKGIVRISIDPYEPRDPDLERRLRTQFGLRHAVVVRAGGRATESARRAIGHFAAPAMVAEIRPGFTVGVAGGRTLGELIRAMVPGEPVRGVDVVQLMGHIDPTARNVDAPELGRALSHRFGGSFATLTAPVFAPDRPTRDAVLALEQVRAVWDRFATLDLAFVGVGTMEESIFIERGVLTAADYASLRTLGAVGEICGRFFDAGGGECASPYRDRVIAVDLEELRRRPAVVAVTHGTGRTAAILAALRGGLINSLVIDDLGAEALLVAARRTDPTGRDPAGVGVIRSHAADRSEPRIGSKGGAIADIERHHARAVAIPRDEAGGVESVARSRPDRCAEEEPWIAPGTTRFRADV